MAIYDVVMTPEKDRPWIFRTYAGYANPAGDERPLQGQPRQGPDRPQRRLRPPTQTGYDSDHLMAKGEVGKVGVPISHIGDMRAECSTAFPSPR